MVRVRTLSALCKVALTNGLRGARNRRSPRGGAAYLNPSHCVIPLPLFVPKYFEYPRSTVGLIVGVNVGAANAEATSARKIKILSIFQFDVHPFFFT